MSTRILGFGIIATGTVVLAIALIIGIGFPKFVYHENLKSACVLSTDHSQYDLWTNETYWKHWNRVYYWHLANKDDFLYRSSAPVFVQKGPYVYLENHSKIDIKFVSAFTEFRVWRQQSFDAASTQRECGATCAEDDEVFISEAIDHLNIYLETLNNDDWNVSSTYEILGALDSSAYPPGPGHPDNSGHPDNVTLRFLKRNYLFGAWIGRNDSDIKAQVLRLRSFRNYTETEMRGLYDVIGDEEAWGDTQQGSCSVDWTAKDSADFLTEFKEARRTASSSPRSRPCGFLALLLKFKACFELQRVSRYCQQQLPKLYRLSASLLCSDPDNSCFDIPKDTISDVHLLTIHDYVVSHLTRYVFYVEFLASGEDLVTTRTQRELTRGRSRNRGLSAMASVDGVVEDFEDRETASRLSPLVAVYNCYDAVQATTSGLWRAYNGCETSTASQFPRASYGRRRISRSLRYQLPPVVNLTACRSYALPLPYYSVFLPEFWRTLNYTKEATNWRQTDRLVFDRNNLVVDGEFVFESGLQDMSGVNGYKSWVSLPHFLFANETLYRRFNMTPSSENHLPYRDFEPMTGVMWQDVVRYQMSVGIRSDYVTLPRPTLLRINSNEAEPLPVYWIEKSFEYNEEGVEHFRSMSSHYMKVSCAGLISLSVIAGVVILLGVIAATVTLRDGKVAPIVEEQTFF